MPTPITYDPTAPTSSGGGFAGSNGYALLGITSTQANQRVTLTAPIPVTGANDATISAEQAANAGQTMSVQQALQTFEDDITTNPAFAAAMSDQLYSAGLMTDSVYNSQQISAQDIYSAYKVAVLRASATGQTVDAFIHGAQASFTAQGGPKVKLPQVRFTAPLTSYDDVAQAADSAFEQVLGHRASDELKAALTTELNNLELAGKNQEAQSEYSQVLALRGLTPQGTLLGAGSGVANQAVAAQTASSGRAAASAGQGQGTASATPAQPQGTAAAGSGSAPTIAGLPTTVTNAQGQTSTVTQGPVVNPYNAAPSPGALAYQTAMQNNRGEVNGRTIAAAMQAISNFVGQKG
jgi:hypothetical protein